MILNDRVNINNLYSLYNIIGRSYPDAILIQSEEYSIVKTSGSAWPNLAFIRDINSIGRQAIAAMTEKMLELGMTPLIFAGTSPEVWGPLRENGYMPAEQTIGMYYELADDHKYSSTDQEISIITDSLEIGEWTRLVSTSLFESKPLPAELFELLGSGNAVLMAIRAENEMAGTSLIYYDELNVAGIYMVAVKPAFRGRGLAKRLIKSCFRLLSERNAEQCYLQSTKMGLPLYESMGFKRMGNYILYVKIK